METDLDPALRKRLVDFRRDLHRHPELSGQETRTTERICEALVDLGVNPQRRFAPTGVVADIPGASDGPMVAIRADIDALPISEASQLEFASEVPGVMHACGHDVHTTMVLGAAYILARRPPPTPVRLIFQPAEETGAGAKAVIEQGVLHDVGMIFGGHVDPRYAVGTIVTHAGAVNASTDDLTIDIVGSGGHAARPHETSDVVVAAASLITALQTIVSREIHPAKAAVLTIAMVKAGEAANVMAERAQLRGTVRALDPTVRDHMVDAIGRMCEGVATAHRVTVTHHVSNGTPVLINTEPMLQIARSAADRVVPRDRQVPLAEPNMGGEDFGWYLASTPGCFVRFGAKPTDREVSPAHSPGFVVDEGVIDIGVQYFANVVVEAAEHLLGEGGRPRG